MNSVVCVRLRCSVSPFFCGWVGSGEFMTCGTQAKNVHDLGDKRSIVVGQQLTQRSMVENNAVKEEVCNIGSTACWFRSHDGIPYL